MPTIQIYIFYIKKTHTMFHKITFIPFRNTRFTMLILSLITIIIIEIYINIVA